VNRTSSEYGDGPIVAGQVCRGDPAEKSFGTITARLSAGSCSSTVGAWQRAQLCQDNRARGIGSVRKYALKLIATGPSNRRSGEQQHERQNR
jgi:hypothetical protein